MWESVRISSLIGLDAFSRFNAGDNMEKVVKPIVLA